MAIQKVTSISRSKMFGLLLFGASQCVRLRSEAAKARLPHELRHAPVLIITESNALEFDDLILLNSFMDSAYDQ